MDSPDSPRRSILASALLVSFIVVLSAILVSLRSQSTPPQTEEQETTLESALTETQTEIRITPTEPIEADCGWQAEVFVWIDLNGNGIRDDDEPPMEEVEVNLNVTMDGGDTGDVGVATTSFDGLAYPGVWLPCEQENELEILALTPRGYEPTTSQPIHTEAPPWMAPDPDEAPYMFGFHPLSEEVLPASRESRYTCKLYHLPDGEGAEDLEVGPDGTLWAAGFFELMNYDPASDQFVVLPRADLSEGQRNAPDAYLWGSIWRGTWFGSDGSIWLHGLMEGMHYSDGSYRFYSDEGSLQEIGVPAAAQSPDGTLWFIDDDSGGPPIYSYQPATGEWHVYTRETDLWVNRFPRRLATNSIHWLLEVDPGTYSFNHIEEDGYDWTITEFELTSRDVTVVEFSGLVRDIDVTDDGIVWMVDSSGFLRFDPVRNVWSRYDAYAQNTDQFFEGSDLAIAPDGSVWLASGDRFGILIQLVPLSADSNEAEWYVYDTRDGLTGFGALLTVAATSDGSIWTTGFTTEGNSSGSIARCQPVTP